MIGGLVEILRELPRGHKSRPFYENLFVEMCERLVGLQRADGFWSASLLDPESYPSPETSGTGFYVYGLAYGVNEGLLSRERFLPAVEKGWKALLSAVEEDGRLGYVQPVGADPRKVARQMTEPYGPGAFLLAGTEIYRMASGEGTEKNISSERVREIAAMLPDKPQGLGLTYKNREHWNQLLQTPEAEYSEAGFRKSGERNASFCGFTLSAPEQDRNPSAGRKHDECPLSVSLAARTGRVYGEQKAFPAGHYQGNGGTVPPEAMVNSGP